jgi:hypothetical protein
VHILRAAVLEWAGCGSLGGVRGEAFKGQLRRKVAEVGAEPKDQ